MRCAIFAGTLAAIVASSSCSGFKRFDAGPVEGDARSETTFDEFDAGIEQGNHPKLAVPEIVPAREIAG